MSFYSQKKVLVVDDFPEFRMSIRQMLLSLKVSDIHMANNGEEALRICQKNKFDIILCDYNLGEGKDGQQLLEELREFGLLKHTSVFMMLTAENTVFMVMGAIENSPDAYLTKPFTRHDLTARLDRLIAFKDEMESVNKALDKKNYPQALEACDAMLQSKTKIASHILRVKASILLAMDKPAQAQTIFKMVIKSRPMLWAQMGLARTLFLADEYEQAKVQLEEILDKNENYLEAYDLLAEVHLALGDSKAAQQTLTYAITKSAKSPQRQHRLGEIAKENNDIDTATRALRRTVELSQNGLHQSPHNVLDYVEVLKEKASQDESLSAKKAGAEALSTLGKYKKEIRKDPNTNVYSKILESKIYRVQNKEAEAIKAAKEGRKLQETLGQEVGPDVVAELASVMLECAEYEDAASLLSQLESMDLSGCKDEEKLKQLMAVMLENEELSEFHNALNENNKKGVNFYDEGLLGKAIDEFRVALESAENSITINLNLVQSLIKAIQVSNEIDEEYVIEAQECFDRIGEIDRDNPRYGRYSDLHKLYSGYKSKLDPEEGQR